jgi:hypothetical protein
MGMQATSKGNMPVVLLKEGGSETKLQQPKLLLKLFIPALVHEAWIKC